MKRVHATAILGLLLLIQGGAHIFLSTHIFVNDEGHFLAYAWFTAKGEVIYRDFFEHRPPLLDFVSAPVILLFGPSLAALRMLSTASMLATTILVFFIARKVYGDGAALFSAAAFVLAEPLFFGFWFVAEPFLAFLLAAGAACAVFGAGRKSPVFGFALSGFASGLAVLVKPQAIIFLALFAVILYIHSRRKQDLLAFLSGAVAPFLLISAYFLANGALADFLYYAYPYSVLNAGEGYTRLLPTTQYDLILATVFVLAWAYAACMFCTSRTVKPEAKLFICAWAVSSLAFAFPRFDVFHLVPALPAFAVMLWRERAGAIHRGILISLLLVCILAFASLFAATGVSESRQATDTQAAAYIAARTSPSEKIFVAPFTPQVYAYAERGHASKYLTLGPWFMTPQREGEIIQELEASKPRYIYYFNGSFEGGETMREFAPLLYAYMFENYAVDASFDDAVILAKR